jgi:hypothetical protein
MIRKPEILAVTVLMAAHCSVALGQSPPATILTLDLENFVLYQTDVSDLSKYATNPSPTPSVLPKNFYVETLLADIVAVNGQPAKGLYAARGKPSSRARLPRLVALSPIRRTTPFGNRFLRF